MSQCGSGGGGCGCNAEHDDMREPSLSKTDDDRFSPSLTRFIDGAREFALDSPLAHFIEYKNEKRKKWLLLASQFGDSCSHRGESQVFEQSDECMQRNGGDVVGGEQP